MIEKILDHVWTWGEFLSHPIQLEGRSLPDFDRSEKGRVVPEDLFRSSFSDRE